MTPEMAETIFTGIIALVAVVGFLAIIWRSMNE